MRREHLVNSALVRLSLVPRPTEFYDLFARAGANALEAARQAETRFRDYPNSAVTQADVKSKNSATTITATRVRSSTTRS